MGYGHQRAVFPLLRNATTPKEWGVNEPMIISANNYPGIPKKDQKKWRGTRTLYEFVSRMRKVPLIGPLMFGVMDYVQRIEPFYPKRDMSMPHIQTRQIYSMIQSGLGKHLIDTLNKEPLPFITSFFIPAFCAEEHGYKGEIYCLCTDTDISRAWAPLYPKNSRINYFAPNHRVKERLMLYGIQEEKITVTGFPLPLEAFSESGDILDYSVIKRRIVTLDPQGVYRKKNEQLVSLYMGELPQKSSDRIPVLTFAVGGAGAQADIGLQILASLRNDILEKRIAVNMIAGTSEKVRDMFEDIIKRYGIQSDKPGTGTKVVYHEDKFTYFKMFNEIILETDILWTKPSELSFYAGLGLPIIIAPALGSQEEYNTSWLHMVGAGFPQYDPRYTHEWLFDWINSGWLAEAAMNGYLDAPKRGTYHIEDSVFRGIKSEIESIHFL